MEKRILILLLMVPIFLSWHWYEPAARKNQAGIRAYQEEKYEEALKQFLSAKGIKPDLAALKNNTAASLYQMKKYQEALEEFSKIDLEKAEIRASDFHYNLGNSFFRLNQFDKALASYRKALLDQPDDIQAKKNFEITLRKIQEQQQKDQNQDQNQDKDQEEQNQKEDRRQKHQNVLQYLDQKEQKQMKDKERKIGVARKEKDW